MQQNFNAALAFAWRPENDGQGYHEDAHDPGGETNRGVTYETWNEAAQQGLVSGELKDATKDSLAKVLYAGYWRVCCCDSLPSGVDLVVFDMAMVSGPANSGRILQRVLSVGEDGDIGPVTLAAALKADARAVIEKMTSADEAFFGSLHTFTYFGNGWDRRAEDAKTAALALV